MFMAVDRDDDAPAALNMFDTLLLPLRLPDRAVSDIETLTRAVVGLRSDAKEHLSSVDERAGLPSTVSARCGPRSTGSSTRSNKLEQERRGRRSSTRSPRCRQASIDRIEGRVEVLASLEETVTGLIGALRSDLNDRMIAVQDEIHTMRTPLQQMASDVAKIDDLLPDPKDGPLTRLKDTLTPG